MSCSFEIGDTTVWSPALRVGALYVRMLEDVSATLDVPTGLTAVAADMWDIDLGTFETAVRTMYGAYFSSAHHVLTELLSGVLMPSLVMLERGGRAVQPRSVAESTFIGRSRGLSMPR